MESSHLNIVNQEVASAGACVCAHPRCIWGYWRRDGEVWADGGSEAEAGSRAVGRWCKKRERESRAGGAEGGATAVGAPRR